jgi:transaldolase
MDEAVEDEILDELWRKFPDFWRAYEPNGMTIDEFDSFWPDSSHSPAVHRFL